MKSKSLLAICAMMLLYLVASPPTQAADNTVGYIQKAEGTVTVTCEGGEEKTGAFDTPILSKDVVTTGAGSVAQIMFLDKTVLAMDENSAVSVFDVYTPKKGGMFDMSFIAGTARLITSEVLSDNPEKFRAVTPLGTIGIRGTELGLLADPDREVVMLYEGGPAYYTDGQIPGLSDADHADLCAKLADAYKKVSKAYEEVRYTMNVSGKRKTKKQLAKVRESINEYHCVP